MLTHPSSQLDIERPRRVAALFNKVVVTSITASTGLFVGNFTTGTLAFPLVRKADFKGIIVPHLRRGGGFFVFPGSALTTSPIYSGKVLIEAN
jgi:hypothetical protein